MKIYKLIILIKHQGLTVLNLPEMVFLKRKMATDFINTFKRTLKKEFSCKATIELMLLDDLANALERSLDIATKMKALIDINLNQ